MKAGLLGLHQLWFGILCFSSYAQATPCNCTQPPIISARYIRIATEIKLSARYRLTSNSSWVQLAPFSSQRDFPVSLCARFQDGLDICLQTNYRRYFPQHSVVQLLNATHQRKTLQAMLQAAQQAEDDVIAVQHVARVAMGLS